MFNLSKSLYGRPADCVLIAFVVYASVLIDKSLKFTCLLSFEGSVTLFPCEDYTFYLINLASVETYLPSTTLVCCCSSILTLHIGY